MSNTKNKKEKENEGPYKQSLRTCKVETLKAMCKVRNLPTGGSKDEMIGLLVQHYNESQTTSITISNTKIKRKSQRNKPSSSKQQNDIPPVELLVDGYIREEYMHKFNKLFPHDLTKLFCEFLDHIWVLPEKYNHVMKRNGSLLFRPPLPKTMVTDRDWRGRKYEREEKQNVDMIIGYSRGFEKGVFEFKLKCIKPGRDAIGIMSEIDECEVEQWITAAKGNTYYYVAGSQIANGGGLYSGSYTKNAGEQFLAGEVPWKTGDVIKMRVDCNAWTCTWFKNNEQVGHIVHIERNCVYHPVLATSEDGIEYELTL